MAVRLTPDRPAFVPSHAMVLAAGLGLRMRPLTQNVPKPLLEVGGATMLDHALDRLEDAGVTDVVVNTHWLPEKIEAHLECRAAPSTVISREDDLLETGGGITKALPHLGEAPFYAANADIVWRDGPIAALHRMAAAWNDDEMDALLLVSSTVRATGYDGDGDFLMDPVGLLERNVQLLPRLLLLLSPPSWLRLQLLLLLPCPNPGPGPSSHYKKKANKGQLDD